MIGDESARRRPWLPVLALLALLGLTWLVYWPGRSGGFLFDDYSNLDALGNYGPIDRWWKVVAFVTSGFAGPTGRPLALASFLLDARDWPAAAQAFKLTNVAIHLACGVLLAGLLRALSRALGAEDRRAAWIGVLAAGMWMLDPFWVSTTLYVVQRMAMLAALFVFAGLWAYAHGRERLRQRRRGAWPWMSAAIVLGTPLAVLSKENGALLPLLAWLLEAFVLGRDGLAGRSRGFALWKLVFLVLPSLLLLAYLATYLPAVWEGARGGRAFTPGERLLSESRIVWTYLRDIWTARAHDGGLFHDDVAVSTGWLHPLDTLPAVLGLLALGLAAWRARTARSAAWVAAGTAVMFYFAGQLIESTWIQLELVFEHRNYLPAALMFWPLAWLAVPERRHGGAPPSWCRPSLRWLRLAMLGWIAVFALQTARRASEWGEPFQQALVWAGEHPDSPRAQGYLANLWSRAGNQAEAARLLDAGLRLHPRSLVLLIDRAGVACVQGSAPPGLAQALLGAAAAAPLGNQVVQYQVGRLIAGLRGCGAFGAGFNGQLLAAALRSPQADLPQVRRDLLHQQALHQLAHGDAAAAYALDLRALRLPGLPPGARLRFAAELGSAGHPRLALRLLDAVASPLAHIHGWSMASWNQRWLRHVGFYRQSESHMRRVLRQQIAAAAVRSAAAASPARAPAAAASRPAAASSPGGPA